MMFKIILGELWIGHTFSVLEFRVSVGLRIEELRKSLNLSRKQLADRIPGVPGIDQRQIADYELYGVHPEPENLEKLSLALEEEVRDIHDFSPERVRASVPLEVRLANRMYRSDRGVTRRGTKDPNPGDAPKTDTAE
jgi:transcriptional regulator with XRE-family HTH domain